MEGESLAGNFALSCSLRIPPRDVSESERTTPSAAPHPATPRFLLFELHQHS